MENLLAVSIQAGKIQITMGSWAGSLGLQMEGTRDSTTGGRDKGQHIFLQRPRPVPPSTLQPALPLPGCAQQSRQNRHRVAVPTPRLCRPRGPRHDDKPASEEPGGAGPPARAAPRARGLPHPSGVNRCGMWEASPARSGQVIPYYLFTRVNFLCWHLTHHMEERLQQPSYQQLSAAFFLLRLVILLLLLRKITC